MGIDQLAMSAWAALTEHVRLPAGLGWTPAAGLALLTAFGLLMMVRGARWARGLGSIVFLGIGGLAGTHVANWLQTPVAPTVAVTAVAAFLMSLGLFRIWQAAILSACCLVAGVGAYYVHDLVPAASAWVGDGQQITLRPAGAAAAGATSIGAAALSEVQSLWTHLSSSVPNFQFNFVAIAVGASLAGLIFGLALPRASKSLWAATIGTLMLGVGATGLMQTYAPDALNWLLAEKEWAWASVGTAWVGSFLYNLVSSGKKKPRSDDGLEAAPAAAAA